GCARDDHRGDPVVRLRGGPRGRGPRPSSRGPLRHLDPHPVGRGHRGDPDRLGDAGTRRSHHHRPRLGDGGVDDHPEPGGGHVPVISGLRYGSLPVNRVGTSAYLVMLAVLITTGFALPAVIGTDGVLGSGQAMVVATLTIGLYAVFLWRQTGAQAADFREAPGMPP